VDDVSSSMGGFVVEVGVGVFLVFVFVATRFVVVVVGDDDW